MTAFTVWKFDTPEGASHAAEMLQNAERDKIVTIEDHAIVSWPQGDERPTLHHAHDSKVRGAGWGALWGGLIGSVFLVPVVGVAVGSAVGATHKAADGLGISKEKLEEIGAQVTEGTSALFLMSEGADLDRLGDRMLGTHMKLIESNLTPAERDSLVETFGDR